LRRLILFERSDSPGDFRKSVVLEAFYIESI